jgi:hypothetical protein
MLSAALLTGGKREFREEQRRVPRMNVIVATPVSGFLGWCVCVLFIDGSIVVYMCVGGCEYDGWAYIKSI